MASNVIPYEEMYKAYEDCRKRKKNTSGAKRFEPNALYGVMVLTDEINSRSYKLMASSCFVITYPTPREVFCAAFRDRIVQHFVYNELNPVIEKKLINDTASCRIGKGTDYAIQRVQRFVRSATDNYTKTAYSGKFDLSGFFMAIDRNQLFEQIDNLIEFDYQGPYKNELQYLTRIIIKTDVTINSIRLCPKETWNLLPQRKTLFGNSYGLPIGNITSQIFANYSLNDVDHFIKSRHRYYVRYVDDLIIVDEDKDKIWETYGLLKSKLTQYHQCFNEKKTKIQDVKYGIDFLGTIIRPYYTALSPKRINRVYYTSSLVHNPKDMVQSASSRKGMFVRYRGYRVARRWYYGLPDEITKEMGMYAEFKFALKTKQYSQKQLIQL